MSKSSRKEKEVPEFHLDRYGNEIRVGTFIYYPCTRTYGSHCRVSSGLVVRITPKMIIIRDFATREELRKSPVTTIARMHYCAGCLSSNETSIINEMESQG